MRKGYPIHYYVQFLVAAKDALRILTFSDMCVVNTKLLPVNDFNAVDLPNDYQDYAFVGGQSCLLYTSPSPRD